MPSLSPFGVINNKVSDKHLCTAFLDHIFSVPSGNTLCVCVFSFFSFFFGGGPHLRHVEVPRLGVKSEL